MVQLQFPVTIEIQFAAVGQTAAEVTILPKLFQNSKDNYNISDRESFHLRYSLANVPGSGLRAV